MARLSFPKLGLKIMFSNNQLMARPDRQHRVQSLPANIKGNTLWKEGNTDLFTPVLRKNSLKAQARYRPFTVMPGGAQRLFCEPSETEEQLSRAGLGKGVWCFPGSHLFLGPVLLSSEDKETGRGKRKEHSILAKKTSSDDSSQQHITLRSTPTKSHSPSRSQGRPGA